MVKFFKWLNAFQDSLFKILLFVTYIVIQHVVICTFICLCSKKNKQKKPHQT